MILLSESVERSLNNTGTAALTGVLVTLGVNVGSAFVKGESMEAMWMLLGSMQILSIMPLCSFSYPQNLEQIFSLLDFSNGENVYIEDFLLSTVINSDALAPYPAFS